MLEAGQRGVLAEAHRGHAHAHPLLLQDGIFHGPRITNCNACCLLAAADCITAHSGRTAGHDQLDDRAVLRRGEARNLLAQPLRRGRWEAERATAPCQPLKMQVEEPRAAMQAGDRLEEAVAEVQAAVEHGKTAGARAVDQGRDRCIAVACALRDHAAAPARGASPKAASSPRALARVSSSSRSGSESATIPAPARNSIMRPARVIVRMRMLKSMPPSHPRSPSAPVYAPRPSPSSSAMISMQRYFGQPVIVPPGNTARKASMDVTSERSVPVTLETMWCTCA